MIEPRSVVHFSIAVSDLEASRKFYTEILGLTLVQVSPTTGMVFLRAGHDHVILAKSDLPLQRDARDSRRAHHAFKVDPEKYEDAKAFLASKGVEIFEEEDRKKGVFVGPPVLHPRSRRHRYRVHRMGRNQPPGLSQPEDTNNSDGYSGWAAFAAAFDVSARRLDLQD